MATKFIDAVNVHTKQKVWVPETYLKLFPDALAKTTTAKAADAKPAAKTTKES